MHLVIQGMLFQIVFLNLPGRFAPGKKPRVIQRHVQNRIDGLVGLGCDISGGLHVLASKIQELVAVIDNRHGLVMAVSVTTPSSMPPLSF